MVEVECFVCGEQQELKPARQAGWGTVVHDGEVRNYCTKERCQAAYEERQAQAPVYREPTRIEDLPPEQLGKMLKPRDETSSSEELDDSESEPTDGS